MVQLDIFDNYRPSEYPNHPGYKEKTTSRQAAVAINSRANQIRAQVLSAIKTLKTATADEIAAHLGLSILSVRPRVSELRSAGLIQRTGERRTNSSGMSAIVWRSH